MENVPCDWARVVHREHTRKLFATSYTRTARTDSTARCAWALQVNDALSTVVLGHDMHLPLPSRKSNRKRIRRIFYPLPRHSQREKKLKSLIYFEFCLLHWGPLIHSSTRVYVELCRRM